MKTKLTTIVTTLALACVPAFAGETAKSPPVVVSAVEKPLAVELSTGYANEYLWRGITLGRDLVFGQLHLEYGIADNTVIEAQGFYGAFNSFDDDQIDGSVGVRQQFGKLTAIAGYSVFDFPEEYKGTRQELYGGFVYALPYDIKVGGTYNFSFEGDTQDYTEVYVSAPYVLSTDAEGNPTQFISGSVTQGLLLEEGEAAHTTLGVTYSYAVSKSLTLVPFFEYNFVQTDYVEGQDDDAFWGVKARLKF